MSTTSTPVSAKRGRWRFFFGGTMTQTPVYRMEEEIEEVMRRFEDCSYTPEEFVHARHLTVAAVYFVRFRAETATDRMQAGLRKFIAHHGKNGYHETMTEFWMERVERAVHTRSEKGAGLLALVNDVVGSCRDKNAIYEYFSRELLGTPEAKTSWVEPDIQSIG
jgi:hypothetical protein